jgi:hypothetical protein
LYSKSSTPASCVPWPSPRLRSISILPVSAVRPTAGESGLGEGVAQSTCAWTGSARAKRRVVSEPPRTSSIVMGG